MLQAGKLDQRIVLRKPTVTKGNSGGVVKGWEEQPAMWAAARHLSGNERPASSAGGFVAVARTEFTVPFRESVTPQWSLIHRGEIYNIKHVNDFMGRREMLVLTCEAGGNDG